MTGILLLSVRNEKPRSDKILLDIIKVSKRESIMYYWHRRRRFLLFECHAEGFLNQRLENKLNQRTLFGNNNADKAAINHARRAGENAYDQVTNSLVLLSIK